MKKMLIVKIAIILVIVIIVLLSVICLTSGAYLKPKYLEAWNKDYYKKYSDDRVKIVSQAILAANGHNMQPWLIKLDDNNSKVLYLYVNTDRLVLNVDPYARQTMISQGTFLEYMNVSAKHIGYDLNIELFPNGEYNELNLVESMKEKAVAKITMDETTEKSDALYDYIFLPDTNRGKYKDEKVSNFQINELNQISNYSNIELKIFNDSENVKKLGEYAINGAEIESKVNRINKESADIFRPNEKEKNKYGYGFSVEGQGTTGVMKYVLESLLTIFPSFNNEEVTAKSLITSTSVAVDNTQNYAMILSKDNSRYSQVESGIIYSRLILKGHSMNLAMQPPSQVLEEYEEMKEQYKNIHNDYAKNGETIQMFFRIGVPTSNFPQSMRQDVMSFIKK